MNIERLEAISEKAWCRKCLCVDTFGSISVSIDKVMRDSETVFQVFRGLDCVADVNTLKEAFEEYELRT